MRLVWWKEKVKAFDQVKTFQKIRRDWLGSGGEPVPLELAKERSRICETCPCNYKGAWVWNIATSIAINSQMEFRRVMGISLDNEDKLHICDVCGCRIQLKVHVPFKHIYAHTSDEQFGKYPAHCWQIQEKKTLTNP